MSGVFADALRHPRKRWPVIAAAGLVNAHLFGVFIPKGLHPLDPIGHLARLAPTGRSRAER